jgi:hypothetical protein
MSSYFKEDNRARGWHRLPGTAPDAGTPCESGRNLRLRENWPAVTLGGITRSAADQAHIRDGIVRRGRGAWPAGRCAHGCGWPCGRWEQRTASRQRAVCPAPSHQGYGAA